MKKCFLILIICFILVPVLVFSEEKKEITGYKDFVFGMSQQEALKLKKYGPYQEKNNVLETNNGVYKNKKVNMSLTFKDSKLQQISLLTRKENNIEKAVKYWLTIYKDLNQQMGDIEFPGLHIGHHHHGHVHTDQPHPHDSKESCLEYEIRSVVTKTMKSFPAGQKRSLQMGPRTRPKKGGFIYSKLIKTEDGKYLISVNYYKK